MPRVRVREAGQARSERAQLQEVTLQPLQVAGIVVRKADIVRALRVYVPGLTDVQVTEDGEHFWLLIGEGGNHGNPSAQ